MRTTAFLTAAALVGTVLGQASADGIPSVQLGQSSRAQGAWSSWSSWPSRSSTTESHTEGHQTSEHALPTKTHHGNETVTTTKVVSRFTTFCPEPTTFNVGTKTFTVTAPTTLTVTECPCTITETEETLPPPPPTKEVSPQPPVQTTAVPQPPVETTAAPQPPPPPPTATQGVVVAGADGLSAAYGFAMAAAGVVGVFAL